MHKTLISTSLIKRGLPRRKPKTAFCSAKRIADNRASLTPRIARLYYSNLKKARKHNNKVRKYLAKKIISLHSEVDKNVSWYSEDKINNLISAKGNDVLIKNALNDIYATDIKKQSNKIITKTAISSCLSTALSQNGLLDSLLLTSINLQMIKDIVLKAFEEAKATAADAE